MQRGDVTLWLSPDAVAAWTPRLSGRPGGPRKFSDHAIETALTLRLVFRLPLRQAVRALAVSPLADECLARAGRHLRLQHPLIEPYVRFWLQAVVRQFWILRSWNSAYCENAIGCNGPHEQQN